MPAFMAGGRYTINGMHYVAEGDELIPASETAFAQDAVLAINTLIYAIGNQVGAGQEILAKLGRYRHHG